MKFSLSSTTVFIATLFIVDSTTATNGTDINIDELFEGFANLTETEHKYLHNETETGEEEMGEC